MMLLSTAALPVACRQHSFSDSTPVNGSTYYLSVSGDDKNRGGKDNPWKTIAKLNSVDLNPGDTVLFEGGQTFTGNLVVDSNDAGTRDAPVVLSSYGNGRAVINGGNESALLVNTAGNVHISLLDFAGSGRKGGNSKNGITVMRGHEILLDHLEIKGFQKAGLLIYASSRVIARDVYAHDNGFAGISVSGAKSKTDCSDILISHCSAANNPGDPTNFDNHSGNGIIAGFCTKVTIEYCAATNNGWDMPRIGNGPVGIWCYEADSVTIGHCISYRNKTAAGAADGGGFDLDGGVTNSVIQYCLSYENQGSAFGIFQYAGASNWYNNTVRYNISENDGNVSAAHAGVYVWNSSRDDKQLKNLLFYNNIIYNTRGAAISYAGESENSGFRFYNNIFVAADTLVTGKETSVTYLSNDWWSLSGGFNIDGINTLLNWARRQNRELLDNNLAGVNLDPAFENPGKASITDPLLLKTFFNYRVPANSPLKNSGLDLRALYGIDTGERNFNLQPVTANGVGATL